MCATEENKTYKEDGRSRAYARNPSVPQHYEQQPTRVDRLVVREKRHRDLVVVALHTKRDTKKSERTSSPDASRQSQIDIPGTKSQRRRLSIGDRSRRGPTRAHHKNQH